jgi:hypothetical protein
MTSDRFDMNSKRHDDYIAECRRIHDRLREISQRTELMAHARCATPDNPNFSRTFAEQTDLLQRLSDLDNQLLR